MGKSDPGVLNNSFYSFGAQHTNIKNNLRPSLLNKKFDDIKYMTVKSDRPKMVSHDNALMNDYTKNISSSIFSPGLYQD